MQKLNFFVAVLVTVCIPNLTMAQTPWYLSGNALSNSSFIGSTNAKDIVFKTNSIENMRLQNGTGALGIGVSNPMYKLEVASAVNPYGATFPSANFQSVLPYGNGTHHFTIQDGSNILRLYSVSGSTFDYYSVDYAGRTTIGNSNSSGKMLKVYGGASFGVGYAGSSAPSNGLIVEGNTGIGVSTIPSGGPTGGYKFAVSGNANIDGSLVIGTTSSFTASAPFPAGYKLFVQDGIITERLKVAIKTTTDWADYVFDKQYKLMPLKEVGKFVTEHKHLPGVPSAEEVTHIGIDVARMDAKLLEKIEELTLYMLQQQTLLEEQQKQIEALKVQINK